MSVYKNPGCVKKAREGDIRHKVHVPQKNTNFHFFFLWISHPSNGCTPNEL